MGDPLIPTSPPPQPVCWSNPPPWFLKINIDVAFKNNLSITRVIDWHHNGHTLGLWTNIAKATSPLEVEMLTLKFAPILGIDYAWTL